MTTETILMIVVLSIIGINIVVGIAKVFYRKYKINSIKKFADDTLKRVGR